MSELEEMKKASEFSEDSGDEGDNVEKAAEEKAQPKPRYKPKNGDYSIQVHLIEARDLKGRGLGDSSDPVVEVEAFGSKKHSSIKKSCFNCRWDEVLYFSTQNMESSRLEVEKIRISVLDANTYRRNVLIGSFEFDLAFVYFQQDHEIFRNWVALTDTTGDHEGVQGYIKLSVVVLGPDDEQKMHSDEDEEDNAPVLMPPHIERSGHLLSAQIYQGTDLPRADEGIIGALCDPYVKIEFGAATRKGSVKKGLNVTFNEEIRIPVMEPIMSDGIKVSLMDYDGVLKDDILGTRILSYAQVKQGILKQPQWINFYGAPERRKGDIADAMNKGYLEGSTYRGKLLLSMSTSPDEDPFPNVESIIALPEDKTPSLTKYIFQVDVYEAIEIPKSGKWSVEFSCGNYHWSSKDSEMKGSVCKWYSAIEYSKGNFNLSMQLPTDPDQVPDVFIYMVRKKSRVSYVRMPFKQALSLGWKTPPRWFAMKEDKALDKLNSDSYPGQLLIGLRCGEEASCPLYVDPLARPFAHGVSSPSQIESNESQSDSSSSLTSIKASSDIGNLKIHVIQAQNLPIFDKTSSDPYVKIKLSGKTFKTQVVKKNLNPTWKETFDFHDVPISTVLNVQTYDHDSISDDLMGETKIALHGLSKKPRGENFSIENWFPVVNERSPDAKIRLKLEYVYHSAEEATALNLKRSSSKKGPFGIFTRHHTNEKGSEYFGQPVMVQYQLRAHIYQCRQLLALDQSGYSDPYVKIRCAGETVKTHTREKTLNPVFYTTKCMSIILPTPLELAPDVSVLVYDRDLIGKDDFLGRVQIPISIIRDMNPSIDELNPQWFDLYDVENNKSQGSILLSFQLLPLELATHPLPILKPKSVPMWIEISTLGLRGMNSTFGVHKPRIDFELPDGKKFSTKSSRIPSSSDPNFLQVLKIPLRVPLDPKFAPALNIEIMDQLFGGVISRRLGSCSLLLENYMDTEIRGWKDNTIEGDLSIRDAKFNSQLSSTDEKSSLDLPLKKSIGTKAIRVDFQGRTIGTTSIETEPRIQEFKTEKMNLLQKETASTKDDFLAIDIDSVANDEKEKIDTTEVELAILGKNNEKRKHVVEWGENSKSMKEEIPLYRRERKVVDDELEDSMLIKPFDEFIITTGKAKRGRQNSSLRKVGIFKGLIRLNKEKDCLSTIDRKDLMTPKDVFVRLYVLRGKGLSPADSNGSSDPYLVVSLGDQVFSLRSKALKNTLEPDFFESFQFPCQVPGASQLKVEVWDWDGIGDDLIGQTVIDIEDRWFCKAWRKLSKKPIEWRTLRRPSSSQSQGKLELWVDIIDSSNAKLSPMIDISPPPKIPFELRMIIWQCKDVAIKDEITQQNDIYVTCKLDAPGYKIKSTDTHLRSKKGFGSFNWRMKFKVELPMRSPRMCIQLWDMDFFSANDSIGETYLNLSSLFKQGYLIKDRVKYVKDGEDKIWVEDFRHPNEGSASQGKVQVSFELVPYSMVDQLPAGEGRSEPNMNPYLPPPEGRLELNFLKPWRILRDLLGENLYRKLCCFLFSILFGAFVLFITPNVFSNMLTSMMGF